MASKGAWSTLLVISVMFWCNGAEAAELKGRVLLEGPPPAEEKLVIEPKKGIHSTEGCGSLVKRSQKLLVDESGGVRNAVVWLEAPEASQKNPAESSPPLLLDQKQCVFEPHVVAVPVGREVAIRNSDTAIHNIRIFREGNPSMLMHRWQKPDSADIRWRFSDPGPFVIRCGVHPWMYAWVFVAPGRWLTVTGESGRFLLDGVPEGRHTLHVWQETLGEKEVSVEVGKPGKIDAVPGREVSVSFQLKKQPE